MSYYTVTYMARDLSLSAHSAAILLGCGYSKASDSHAAEAVAYLHRIAAVMGYALVPLPTDDAVQNAAKLAGEVA